jgi:hypothetical protein
VVVVALAGVFLAAVDVAIVDAEDKHLVVVVEVNNANNLTSSASTPATSSTPAPPTIGPYVRFATRRVTMPLYVGTGSMKIMSQIQNLWPLHSTPTQSTPIGTRTLGRQITSPENWRSFQYVTSTMAMIRFTLQMVKVWKLNILATPLFVPLVAICI